MLRPATLSLLLSLTLLAGKSDGISVDRAEAELVRGMTISCQTWGQEWGSDGFPVELDQLQSMGVNWIAIHPYAWIRENGEVRWRNFDPAEPPEWLTRPIREARARGMSILMKPHLGYWGSPFRWRGDIDFAEPHQRQRFFEDYRRWIVDLARATRESDGFVVATELDRLHRYEDEWRAIIAAVRTETEAHLTVASNWSDYQDVPFWDALDAIGVQAYFPLSESEQPTEEELRVGWTPVLDELRQLSDRLGKPVVFTELGYNTSLATAARPWESAETRGTQRPEALDLQRRCLDVALGVLNQERSWLRGAFLWKWFVGEAPRANYRIDTPPLRGLIARHWTVR